MTERFEICFGCGARTRSPFKLCARCQKLLGVNADGEGNVSLDTVFSDWGLKMEEGKLVRIFQKGLLLKSFIFAGLIVSIILAHPALDLLRSAAHQICRLTSSCPPPV